MEIPQFLQTLLNYIRSIVLRVIKMAEERVKEKEIEEEDQKVLDRLKKIYSETILRKTLFLSIKGDDNSHYT